MRTFSTLRFLFLLIFIVGLIFGGAVVWLAVPRLALATLASTPTSTPLPTPTALADAAFAEVEARDQVMINLYQRVSPSVVHITSRSQSVDAFYGVVPSEGTGSGFVYDTEGHILTNHHVIAGATEVDVELANGQTYTAQVIGDDEYYDLAVIKVDAPANSLIPLALGDSSVLRVGQTVVAIGNPFGLDRTLTSGLVSALGRRVETGQGSIIGQAIQTDAAINPGNSGGPLLDLRGRVIGINTAINSPSGGSVGIGFAVPVNIVKRVVPSLVKDGHYPHPTLNITTAELGSEVQVSTNGPARGLLILKVLPGSTAEKAGLRAATVTTQSRRYVFSGGDIITAVDGKPVNTRNDLLLALEENHQPGDTVTLTVFRNGQSISLSATLETQ